MRASPSLAAILATCLALASDVTAEAVPGTLHYKFEKRVLASLNPNEPRQLLRRQTVNVPVSNYDLLYLINTTVGTPPQKISMQLDTGSSDIWFPSANSAGCQRSSQVCRAVGAYDESASSTYRELTNLPDFEIQYVDGSEVVGTYITDVMTLGGTTVTNLTMASASRFSRALGVMGIGLRRGESSTRQGFTYPNIVNVLQEQGKIQSTAYSLWLDDLAADTGSILFGGIDTDKYTGSLISLPIQRDAQSGQYTSLTVAWTGLTVTGSGNNANLSPSTPQPAILDSGTTLTYLPDNIASSIFDGLGVTSYSNGEVYAVPCSLANNDLALNFQFGSGNGPRISVRLAELVIPLYTTSGSQVRSGGQTICQFGIAPAGENPILFGDTFLRSAYVVYDLDNMQIAMAPTNFNSNSGTKDIRPIVSGSGIPDVTATATSASVLNTFTGNVLATAGATDAAITGSATRVASFSLSPTASSGGGTNGKNAAGRPSASDSYFAMMVVMIGAFVFGAMLI